jgi:hypothetical protein
LTNSCLIALQTAGLPWLLVAPMWHSCKCGLFDEFPQWFAKTAVIPAMKEGVRVLEVDVMTMRAVFLEFPDWPSIAGMKTTIRERYQYFYCIICLGDVG